MIDAIDYQRMKEAIFSEDDAEIELMCACREYAISVASIQTALTEDGNIEKRCIDPMALARIGRDQREHRDKNLCKHILENEFDLVDGVTY
jgi:hypothetical protein